MNGTFTRKVLPNGVEVLFSGTDKFKTNVIRVLFRLPLGEGASEVALVPQVLRRATRTYPTTRTLSAAFEELYGSSLGTDTVKVGDTQVLMFEVHMPSDRYLPEPVFEKAARLLGEVILDPRRQQGHLDPALVHQEKENLARAIAGIYNDKAHYAQMKLIEHMFEGEPYAIFRLGRLQDIPGIEAEGLTARYERLLAESAISVYGVGDIPAERFFKTAEDIFKGLPKRPEPSTLTPPPPPRRTEAREILENQAISQGKLVLGYRCGCDAFSPAFPDLVAGSGILGGFSHSKLFQNVREKASLAYYAYARVEGAKGLMVLSSGIDPKDYKAATDIMQKQVEDMRSGAFSEEDWEQTVRSLENQMRTSTDSLGRIIMTDYELRALGRETDLQKRLERLRQTSREGIMKVFSDVFLDTVFFLTPKEA